MNTRIASLLLVLGTSFVRAADTAPPADVVPHAGLSAQDAVKFATLPPGFKLHVFAAEPDVKQPIAFCEDHRGRLWVAEGYTYPQRAPEGKGKDRILVFEDTDGDHKFDRRTVFMEGLNLVSGLEYGFGGVWVGAAPYLMFIPIADGDAPKPAGPPQILLDGWDFKADTHETLNTFTWGPDGWLYGNHGVFCPSHVGKPGAKESERQWMDAGVWRYHPTQHRFEVFAEGTSNPWGIDFDEHGQLWEEACVIPHLWHMIQGGRYERQGGEHFSINRDETARNESRREKGSRKPLFPYTYDDIKTVADHFHYAGGQGPHAANGRSDAAGGGHAHAGLMCYLGESWPAEYRSQLFIGNIHGQRLNVDIPERSGSGYVGRHGQDFLNFQDSWSQTLNQRYDQNGSVFIIDWYDKNQCHNPREDGHDRSNGRIYKIVYNDQPWTPVDLQKKSDEELAQLVPSKNEWMSRHARRVLQERAKERGLEAAARDALLKMARENPGTPGKLRALWALHVSGALSNELALELLGNADEYVRAWAIQLSAEDRKLSGDALGKLVALAKNDASPVVRLYVAAALQRLAPEDRWDAYAALLQHSEDAADHNLPLMAWYAGEALAATQPAKALPLAVEAKLPKVLNFTTRRIASLGTTEAHALIAATLASVDDAARQLEMLSGLSAALAGQRNVSAPRGWGEVETKLAASPNVAVRTLAQTLSLTFGSQTALAALRKTLADTSAEAPARRASLDALVGVKDSELPPLLRELLRDAALRGPSLRALATYNDPLTPDAILAAYGSLDAAQKRDALNTLVSRPAFAKPLLAAIASEKISAKDLTADVVRQLRGMKDADVQQQLTRAYGTFRETSADKKAEMEKYRAIYRAGYSQPGEAGRGRVIFNRTCAQCHTLFDSGGKVGPDITGANRSDVNYLLENILDPNAVIPNEYRVSNVETKDGRSLTGIIKKQDDKSLTIATANETVVLPRNEIETQQQSELSMMPEGLLAALSDQEFRDLIYYLTRPGQVPLPAEAAK